MAPLIFKAVNEENKFIARELLAEYGRYLFEKLRLMDGEATFFKELDTFPGDKYKYPDGAFFIIFDDEHAIGCVGLKRFDETACELKRMYIKEASRGKGFAKAIVNFILDTALRLGYQEVLLDTNVEMASAVNVYHKAGFIQIPPYCENTNKSPLFFAYYLNNKINNEFQKPSY